MEFIEIIQIRTAYENTGLKQLFKILLNETKTIPGLTRVCLFTNAKLITDLSIHLHWQLDKPLQDGSETGLSLAHILKEYGLINHNIWIKE